MVGESFHFANSSRAESIGRISLHFTSLHFTNPQSSRPTEYIHNTINVRHSEFNLRIKAEKEANGERAQDAESEEGNFEISHLVN